VLLPTETPDHDEPCPFEPRERALEGARTLVLAFAAVAAASGCARGGDALVQPGRSAVARTGGPNASMIYVARVDGGAVIAVDLGWWGAQQPLRRALRGLGASPAAVTDVFLTHTHRDHVGAWRLVRGSRFHLAAAERGAFAGEVRHRGWIPRLAERVWPSDLPRRGEVAVRTFSRDTAFAFGADTVFAYVVPGHTAGSAAYLHRGRLFLGDAATHTPWGGYAPARRGYSDDAARAARSLRALWRRLPPDAVRHVCTAHARCAPFSAALLRDLDS